MTIPDWFNLNATFHLFFAGFNKYSDLEFNCNDRINLDNKKQVCFIPNKPLLLDETPRFKKILVSVKLTINLFEVHLLNIKGLVIYKKYEIITDEEPFLVA